MLLLIAVLAVMSAAFLLQLILRRQTRSLPDTPVHHLESTNLRPLFEPSAADLKREADAESARAIARREYHAAGEVAARVDVAVNAWRSARDRASAIEMLRVTSESGREGDLA